jgi:hypothetical protein
MFEPVLLDTSPGTAHHFPTIGELVTNRHAVPSDTPVRVVSEELLQNPELDGGEKEQALQ